MTEHKPAPDGLLKIGAAAGDRQDAGILATPSTMRAAPRPPASVYRDRAPHSPRRAELVCAFRSREGAIAVLDDINQLEGVLG